MDFAAHFKQVVQPFIGIAWSEAEGVSAALVVAAEQRLGVSLPDALRAFFATVGSVGVVSWPLRKTADP